MADPSNPLCWVQSAQDWFTKAEKSSGFRPLLIFWLLSCPAGLAILWFFPELKGANYIGFGMIIFPAVVFLGLFIIKAFQEPDFCRSEVHVQRMRRMEVENLGTESKQMSAEIIEQELLTGSVPEKPALPRGADQKKEST